MSSELKDFLLQDAGFQKNTLPLLSHQSKYIRMKVELKGDNLVITIPANIKDPKPSASGKTLIVASSKGNQETELKVNGCNLTIGVNAYITAQKS